MIHVDDVQTAMNYYANVFGLKPTWWDDESAGLVFPESDTEIVVHCKPDIPSRKDNFLARSKKSPTLEGWESC
jgi:hypothetical protein